MKIVNIIGGLGNQMFQYAFACALKHKWPEQEVLIDTSHFHYLFLKKIGATNLHNGYEIDKVFPNACLPRAGFKQISKVSRYIPNYVLSRFARKYLKQKDTEIVQKRIDNFAFRPEVLEIAGDYYYEGIWEAAHYFISIREILRGVFTPKEPDQENASMIGSMEEENSVGIHIRRGDYMYMEAFMGICDLEYYKKGISTILEDGKDHTFYVFSNDLEWCEQNIKPLVGKHKIIMVDHNKGNQSCWDMFLMTHCKDLIIANSSFSWWGAFLNNRNGRIIAPDKWVNREAEYDIWLPEWIRL